MEVCGGSSPAVVPGSGPGMVASAFLLLSRTRSRTQAGDVVLRDASRLHPAESPPRGKRGNHIRSGTFAGTPGRILPAVVDHSETPANPATTAKLVPELAGMH